MEIYRRYIIHKKHNPVNENITVSTDDEVRGQFTIPGLRTFNVVTPDENRNLRRRNVPDSTENNINTESEASESTSSEVEHEAGDMTEQEININVRYLDESVMNCSFRPSQSLGHFKCNIYLVE